MKLPITVIILTKNESKAIVDCISSVNFCNQILVVDSASIDNTRDLAKQNGATIIDFAWNGSYPKKKQWSLELSEIENNWVLFLDADERISHQLVSELIGLFESHRISDFHAYEISIDYIFLNKLLRYGHKVKKIFLVDKRFARFPEIADLHITNMWEVEGHYQPMIDGRVGKCESHIIHNDPDPLFDYFSRHNRYSDWEAELRMNPIMKESVRKLRTKQGALFDYVPGKPFLFFIYSYILKSGWRDGLVGFNYALSLSFYYWQISAKVLEKKYRA